MLQHDVVVVAGGGSGLGLGVAHHCLDEGASVAILDVSAEKVQRVADELGPQFEGRVLPLIADVTNGDDLERARNEIVAAFGKIDAVIGCQGIFDASVRLADTTVDRIASLFDEIMRVNVLGYLMLAKVFHDDLEESHGSLVVTASTAAYAADGGGAFYTASKGAIRSLVGQLAFEFAPNVRVNGVAPAGIANSQLRGPASLGMADQKQSDIPKDAFLSVFRRISLLQDLPAPEEYGPIYALLASHQNTTMTGQMIVADQGLLNRAVLSAASE